jgi:alpha-tubulin suppressor-like RCC1 family protein
VRDIALASGGLCGIDEAGTTFCNHSSFGAFSDLVPPPADRLSAIAVGYQFACGILASDSTLLCWGSAGTEACAWAPVAGQLDAPDGTFVQISSRDLSTCAVGTDGELACWGAGEPNDDPAELCRDGTFNYGQSSPPSGTFRSVSMGNTHGCAVRVDGTVACWGIGTTDSNCGAGGLECGQAMPPSGTFDQIAVGAAHTCGMRADRTVLCWGYDGDDRTTPPAPFQ